MVTSPSYEHLPIAARYHCGKASYKSC